MIEVIVIYGSSTVLLFGVLWLLLGGRQSDAELHEAARRAAEQRKREAWTSPDGRTVR